MRAWKAALAQVWQLQRAALRGRGGGAPAMGEAEARELLGTASAAGDVEGMQRAEAAGADVRAAVYYNGYYNGGSMGGTCTAAYLAARDNHGGGLRFLVGACGVDPNAVGDTDDGETPLKVACGNGHTDAATVLLALGADPTVANKRGRTPCMNAAYSSGSVPCLEALAAGGPGGALGDAVNAMDKDGDTALDDAVSQNHDEYAAVLRELGGKRAADL